jgi:hypothetical protein
MKISALLAGAAALTMIAGAAQADVVNNSFTRQVAINPQGNPTTNPVPLAPNQVSAGWTVQSIETYSEKGTLSNNNATVLDQNAANATDVKTFTLTGSVNKDCSFHAPLSNNGARTINLGVIGVNTGSDNSIADAFNQVSAGGLKITTASAGCNTKNTITVAKAADGMSNTANTGGFDSNQFTNKIPYSVQASWTSGAADVSQAGVSRNFTVATNAATGSATVGAWRSSLSLDVVIPAQTLGLLAGSYSDTVTVTLAAL